MAKYVVTAKGRKLAGQKRIVVVAPNFDTAQVIQYLAGRKTPATIREIYNGVRPKSRLAKAMDFFTAITPTRTRSAVRIGIEFGYIAKA